MKTHKTPFKKKPISLSRKNAPLEKERLQKLLARGGLGSRRSIEEQIRQGRISINGEIASLGALASAQDKIRIDGKLINLFPREQFRTRILIYNKPEHEICTHQDPENRPTVFQSLPRLTHSKWLAIGRLDINSQGLMIFTNNGELANALMHPKYQIEREYAVRVFGEVSKEILQKLKEGVMLEDGPAHFDSIMHAGGEGLNQWYHVSLHEGRNREIRRMWESQGVQVSRLIRVRFGQFTLPRDLPRGKFRELDKQEVEQVLKVLHLEM